ncbi:hypothetical protein Pelo_5079 [Pelomyxa schiedti]|nr:hypothetical protein Pelo_5079 [Pelomyxa schiedti]
MLLLPGGDINNINGQFAPQRGCVPTARPITWSLSASVVSVDLTQPPWRRLASIGALSALIRPDVGFLGRPRFRPQSGVSVIFLRDSHARLPTVEHNDLEDEWSTIDPQILLHMHIKQDKDEKAISCNKQAVFVQLSKDFSGLQIATENPHGCIDSQQMACVTSFIGHFGCGKSQIIRSLIQKSLYDCNGRTLTGDCSFPISADPQSDANPTSPDIALWCYKNPHTNLRQIVLDTEGIKANALPSLLAYQNTSVDIGIRRSEMASLLYPLFCTLVSGTVVYVTRMGFKDKTVQSELLQLYDRLDEIPVQSGNPSLVIISNAFRGFSVEVNASADTELSACHMMLQEHFSEVRSKTISQRDMHTSVLDDLFKQRMHTLNYSESVWFKLASDVARHLPKEPVSVVKLLWNILSSAWTNDDQCQRLFYTVLNIIKHERHDIERMKVISRFAIKVGALYHAVKMKEELPLPVPLCEIESPALVSVECGLKRLLEQISFMQPCEAYVSYGNGGRIKCCKVFMQHGNRHLSQPLMVDALPENTDYVPKLKRTL